MDGKDSMFDDSLSFRLMRHRYGVGILFVLLEREKAYQNEIRRILGAEIQPIAYSLAFLLAEGLIHEKPFPADSRIKSEFVLTVKALHPKPDLHPKSLTMHPK